MSFIKKILSKDPKIWEKYYSPIEHKKIIGWVDLPKKPEFYMGWSNELNSYMKNFHLNNLVIIGMGGSINGAKAIYYSFPEDNFKYPVKFIDTVNPDLLDLLINNINFNKTLFVISSKSGTTIETITIEKIFREKYKDFGMNSTKHFLCITDKNSPLDTRAKNKEFGKKFITNNEFGGRYSALSEYGLISILLENNKLQKILNNSEKYYKKLTITSKNNDAINLGNFIYKNIIQKKNKLTFITEKKYQELSNWIEQLLSESSGKNSNAIIPIFNEKVSNLLDYSYDRNFVLLHDSKSPSKDLKDLSTKLKHIGHQVFDLKIEDPTYIGNEFFKWQIATTYACMKLEINPFDQPDVESSKVNTIKLLDNNLGNIRKNILNFASKKQPNNKVDLSNIEYLALIVFTSNFIKNESYRLEITKKYNKCVSVGIGPQYLHSLGQLYKGATKNIFIKCLIEIPKKDFKIPTKQYTLRDLYLSQALGDLFEMDKRGIPMDIIVKEL